MPNFDKKIILFSVAIYFALRIFSYFFSSPTPLTEGSIINSALSIIIVIIAVYLILKNDWRGWLIIAVEFLLGGSGNILSIATVSIRTIFLAISMIIFFAQIIYRSQFKKTFFKPISIPIGLLILWSIISSIIGLRNGHDFGAIASDFIPYLFLLYYYPLTSLFKNNKFLNTCFNILIAAIIANAMFIFITFILFNSETTQLQGAFYHWFRDVAGGKITFLSDGFYRIVLNEHLLVIPIALYFLYSQICQPKKNNLIILATFSIILAISLTRIYYLALLIALLFLYSKEYWKNWLKYSVIFLFSIFIFYSSFFLFASRGLNLGWEYFGLRIGSIVAPQIEDSSLSRMVLLPEIIEKIKQKPIIGHGLGASITILSPVYGDYITTTHFDWGYLEIISESGIVGLIIWFLLIGYLIFSIINNKISKKSPFIAIIIALLIINLTSPAIFHVFGVILITVILAHALRRSPGEPIDNSKPLVFSKAI
jgi:O-antigen ligase